MKTLSITSITLIVLLSSCGGGQSRPMTPEELRAELQQQELLNPLNYLEHNNVTLQPQRKKVRNGGLFRDAKYADDGALIEGFIVNKSTLAKYKDIKVKVTYYSQTKTLINEEEYVFYEFYDPNTTKQFSIKVYPPKAYETFGFELIGATGVYE